MTKIEREMKKRERDAIRARRLDAWREKMRGVIHIGT